MEHIAIDLGGRESQVCVRSEQGEIVEERRVSTARLGVWLNKRPKSRVVLETCAESFAVADEALGQGHQVRVVPATLVRSLGVGSRGVKSDQKDARILSEVSSRVDLPTVHIPTAESRRRKSVCAMRESLVGARTKLVNSVRGWLRTQSLRVRSGATSRFAGRVRERLESDTAGMDAAVERMLVCIETLSMQIAQADKELMEWVKHDPLCQRLMTVPGVGPVTAVRFAAAVDDFGRFSHAHQLESYFGLVPGEHSSSEHTRRTSITKAGAPRVRWTLIQAAWVARRRRPNDPMVRWCKEIEKRRGKFVAVVALARKLAGVLYAIGRDGTEYQPSRSAEWIDQDGVVHSAARLT